MTTIELSAKHAHHQVYMVVYGMFETRIGRRVRRDTYRKFRATFLHYWGVRPRLAAVQDTMGATREAITEHVRRPM